MGNSLGNLMIVIGSIRKEGRPSWNQDNFLDNFPLAKPGMAQESPRNPAWAGNRQSPDEQGTVKPAEPGVPKPQSQKLGQMRGGIGILTQKRGRDLWAGSE
ncbi:hypothetical protein L6452_37076 [Arctium lappa]|uniref:Uncharacterized protein n=1 Tax=Arctium lappa TaxID=4217 RepID=A0ACB8Y2P0_ARCLA|nr:hypothetical protein L6452_37076 [Arctium lappa]